MATATVSAPAAPLSLDEARPVDLTADQFFKMIEAGVFAPEQRVFLWGGGIFEKMAKTASHAITAVVIQEVLRSRLPDGWVIWPENPIRLDARHAPLPDITVVRGPAVRYRGRLEHPKAADRHPQPEDVGLIVEVAVTSLPKDLGVRAGVFARAMIPTYWVADVLGRKLVEHRGPRVVKRVASYEHVRTLGLEDDIPLILDGREVGPIPVRELLA
jgi:hypothetical protein